MTIRHPKVVNFFVVWKESNNVKMFANHQDALPAQKLKRCSRQNKKQNTMDLPKNIANYNCHVGSNRIEIGARNDALRCSRA